ncbi:hypothetical protein WJU16_03175 [Chitinophaga pollutisoli]|uniref:FHA domain-containing protein n=1 Tax=Chitinophaga pollutisoli TaxID=3133966 RepID=A0ABZ2YRE8_9BACT
MNIILTESQKAELANSVYTFFEGPGHGWLKVPLSHILMLGIEHDITPCSFISRRHGYLEEDDDFGTFQKAYYSAIGDGKVKLQIREIYSVNAPGISMHRFYGYRLKIEERKNASIRPMIRKLKGNSRSRKV